MDTNHPIPQDVTGFQFRLIGDMTVKQFAYVAVGGIFAIVTLYAPLPLIIRIPFMVLFAGAGVAVAFLPIEGRPMDMMISYFLKALLSPNQYVFQKAGGRLAIFTTDTQLVKQATTASPFPQKGISVSGKQKRAQLTQYLTSHHNASLSQTEKNEDAFMERIFQTQAMQTQHIPAPAAKPENEKQQSKFQIQNISSMPPTMQPKQEPEEKPESSESLVRQSKVTNTTSQDKGTSLSLQENVLAKELEDIKIDEASEKDSAKKEQAHLHAAELERQLLEIKQQKEALEKQLEELHNKAASQLQATSIGSSNIVQKAGPQALPQTATDNTTQQATPQAAIRKIPADMAKSLGLPHAPDVPNLIIGIVKDPRGNVLPNILVEVKDKDGSPARAFRTNQLGQFASATPLANGAYTIEFEDPKGDHQFDSLEINAKGDILMPIEVISHDAREELRKALFN